MTQQVQPNKQSPEAKAKAALNSLLEHPFWADLPMAVSKGFDRVEQFFEKGEFDKVLAGGETHAELIVNAARMVIERGKFGEHEAAFLAAARAEFAKKKSFLATTIDFMRVVASSVDPEDKKTPQQVQDHLDLMRLIYIAARDKPQLLELLVDSRYKILDPSVCNNPNLDQLLDDLCKNGCLQTSGHKDAVKAMLSPLRRNWTAERCEFARKQFLLVDYLKNSDPAHLRRTVERSSSVYSKVATKILPIARGLRFVYMEEMVLRFEFICYIMHASCLAVHA